MVRFPWQKRMDDAKAQTAKAETEYEWAVQNRTSVSSMVERLRVHGEQNRVVENLITGVIRGGRRT